MTRVLDKGKNTTETRGNGGEDTEPIWETRKERKETWTKEEMHGEKEEDAEEKDENRSEEKEDERGKRER